MDSITMYNYTSCGDGYGQYGLQTDLYRPWTRKELKTKAKELNIPESERQPLWLLRLFVVLEAINII